ncbi:MAG: ATP-grasp domain-containing protein [Bryobacteraceae bacterium]|nr:ATP-grasp domain-containing protein [Bryobacteraceae bacterium]
MLATTCTPDDRKTLCAARALARRGIRVSVGGDRFLGLAFWSRSVARRFRYPHPGRDAARFARHLHRLLVDHPHDVLLPTNDYTTGALAAHASALSGLARMALPSEESLARAQDKYVLAELSRQLGIESPSTRLARSEGEILTAAGEVGYPCVAKLRRGSGAVGLRIVRGPEQWRPMDLAGRESDVAFDFRQYVVQEFVPGDTHDVCAMFCHGELRAAVTQRRLRTYPAVGGVGVDCVTTDEPALVERATVLMRALEWHGPAQIEFKVDPEGGRVWLIEVNGRLWGTLALAVWAGVDFPWLWYRLALDGDVSWHRPYRFGARYRWPVPLGILHAAQTDARWRSLVSLLGPAPDTGGDWRWSDPAPHAAEFLYGLKRLWRRRRFGPRRTDPSLAGRA